MVDVTRHELGLDDISNILQGFNIEKVFDMNFGLFVFQGDFYNNNGHWCRLDDLYSFTRGTILKRSRWWLLLKLGSTWVA